MTKSLVLRLGLFPFVLAILVFTLPTPAEAGPWTKSAGEYYVKIGESLYRATSHRTGSGLLISGTDYLSATTYGYAEVGVWDDLHLQAYIPLMYARTTPGNETFSDFGMGDARFAVQHSPLDLAFPTSIRLETKIPLYGEPATPQTPARGGQQVDFSLWLSAGGGFSNIPLYLYLDAGYQHRTSWTFGDTVVPEYSDGIVTLAQVGYNVMDTFILAVGTSGVIALEQDQISESYITVGPSVFWPLTDLLAIEFDSYFTPYSRNSAEGWSVGMGLSFRRD